MADMKNITPSTEDTPIMAAGRLFREAIDGLDDVTGSKFEISDKENALYRAADAAKDVIATQHAGSLVDAAIQLTSIFDRLDPLRSPGQFVNAEHEHDMIEFALKSALTAIVSETGLDLSQFSGHASMIFRNEDSLAKGPAR